MVPYWREAGVTHTGMAQDTGESRENIQFAHIFGSARSDYVLINKSGGSVELNAFENMGSGGGFQKGADFLTFGRFLYRDWHANNTWQVTECDGATSEAAVPTTTSGSARAAS